MKLYVFPVAPNPTKVRLYLAEKAEAGHGIELEEVTVSLPEGEQNTAEHAARNPFKRLPVLELDDGSFLIESLPILEYFEELHAEPSMIGTDPLERARVRSLERICETGVLSPMAGLVHATNSPLGLPPNPAIQETTKATLSGVLPVLEQWMEDGRDFVAGERVTIADCTLAAAFQFGRFGQCIDIDAYPRLARWDARYRERPAAKAVLIG